MTTVVMYDEVALARWINEAVRAAGIRRAGRGPARGGVARPPHAAPELRDAVRRRAIAANGFVDASGDAALAWLAGLPCREAADGPIYGTQMVVLEDIDEAAAADPRGTVGARAGQGAAAGLVRHDGFAFVFPGRGTALVNLTHVETPLDPVAASANALEGRAQADKVVDFLRREFPAASARRGCGPTASPASARRAGSSGASSSRSTMCAPARASPMRSRAPPGRSSCTTRDRAMCGSPFPKTTCIMCRWAA